MWLKVESIDPLIQEFVKWFFNWFQVKEKKIVEIKILNIINMNLEDIRGKTTTEFSWRAKREILKILIHVLELIFQLLLQGN